MDYSSLIDFEKKHARNKKNNTKDSGKKENSKRPETRKRPRSDSPEYIAPEDIDYDVPNRQFGDLYCVVCDSHMNSEQMWENHIIGKRHLKNSSKGHATEQKYEYSSDEPTVQKELDKVKPLAGLDHICEIVRINQLPIYQCFLCSASLTTSKLLIEHLTGLKHQLAFLKEHDKEQYALIDTSSLSKSYLEPILHDLIAKYENENGRGKMSVKKEKPSTSIYSYKKNTNDDASKRSTPKSAKKTDSKSSRYSPPPKSRYSPPPKSRYSPPSKSRYTPPRKARYTPQSPRSSPPPITSRMRDRQSESEWEKVPIRESDPYYSDRPYPDEEKWPRMAPEPTVYRSQSQSYLDPYDSRLERASYYSERYPPLDEGRDLRLVLEQKKSLGSVSQATKEILPAVQATKEILPAVPVSTEITDISDKLLSLIHDMSAEVFLSLAVFKLNNMNITQAELKLLERVAERANELAAEARKKYLPPDLKAQFQEVLAQNGLSTQDKGLAGNSSQTNLQFTQNLENFIGHFKSRKATEHEDTPQGAYSNVSKSSEPVSSYQSPPERSTTSDSGWNQRQTSALPFQSFSSTPSYIPGLEMVHNVPEEPKPQPTSSSSSVLSQFAQAAKDIFGNISVPTSTANPYNKDDYNRLNYRY